MKALVLLIGTHTQRPTNPPLPLPSVHEPPWLQASDVGSGLPLGKLPQRLDLFQAFKKFLRSHLIPWSISQDRRETSVCEGVVPSLPALEMRVFLKHIHVLARLLVDEHIPALRAIDGVPTVHARLLLLHFRLAVTGHVQGGVVMAAVLHKAQLLAVRLREEHKWRQRGTGLNAAEEHNHSRL